MKFQAVAEKTKKIWLLFCHTL